MTTSDTGGNYSVAEPRANSAKNTKLLYIPDHQVIKNCETQPSNVRLCFTKL